MHTYPPVKSLLFSVTFVGLASFIAGCKNEYEIVPDYPTAANDVACLAKTQSWYESPPGSQLHAGHSADIASTGPATGNENQYRWLISGAPGQEADDDTGTARATFLSTATGLVDTTSSYHQALSPSGVGTYFNLGWDVLAADIRACHAGSGYGKEDGCGQEILVSAPDTFAHSTRGRVFWWKADGDSANSPLEYGGALGAPTGSSYGAEFGYAMATSRLPADAEEPWDIGGTYVDRVAISAPGDGKVYIYEVDETSATPLPHTPVQTLTAPLGGRGYGHEMAVGYFDSDAYPDLAVSGPLPNGFDHRGFVWIYRGQSGSTPLDTTSVLRVEGMPLGAGPMDTTHFGWSLATGPLAGDHTGDALVVGAPGVGSDDDGGVCQYLLTPSGVGLALDDEYCWTNDHYSATSSSSSYERLGSSVAIGNFHAMDSHGNEDTTEALLPELAIGRPGYDGGRGAVEVYATNDAGFDETSYWTSIQEWTGPYSGAQFGKSMGYGYVQESFWEDLAVGAPTHVHGSTNDGTASLTKAVDNSACVDINGYWGAYDLYSTSYLFSSTPYEEVEVKIWRTDIPSETHILFLENFWWGLFEDFGTSTERVCQQEIDGADYDAIYYMPAGTEITLPSAWNCGATSTPWAAVDATPLVASLAELPTGVTAYMDVEMALPSSTEMTLDITNIDVQVLGVSVGWGTVMTLGGIDSADCEAQPIPFDLTQLSPGVCE